MSSDTFYYFLNFFLMLIINTVLVVICNYCLAGKPAHSLVPSRDKEGIIFKFPKPCI